MTERGLGREQLAEQIDLLHQHDTQAATTNQRPSQPFAAADADCARRTLAPLR